MSQTHLDPALDRRSQILDAALVCFAKHGFHQASMHDISAEAGISVGLIYRYFENKEAVIAAIYLDGGLEPASAFVLRTFAQDLQDLREAEGPAGQQDYKTRLQEWCQRRFETLPQYVTVRESGPDHQKTFEVELMVQGNVMGVGVGRSKKEAEQMAAKQALEQAASS